MMLFHSLHSGTQLAATQIGGARMAFSLAAAAALWGVQGFWVNNGICEWPVNSLTVGSVTYDKAQLVRILDTANGTPDEVRGHDSWSSCPHSC